MPAPAQPTGFGPEILQPFSIPTSAPTPIQKAPNLGLTFPVFTPPAASSYGTTNPMAVPWTPPDLAGAINQGIKTGAGLATDALTNRKSLQQIQAEEQAQKQAIIAQNQPGAAQRTSVEVGPGGTTTRMISPAELQLAQSQLAERNAQIARMQAEIQRMSGMTPAEIAEKQAQAKRAEAEAARLGGNPATRAIGFTGAGANVNTKGY